MADMMPAPPAANPSPVVSGQQALQAAQQGGTASVPIATENKTPDLSRAALVKDLCEWADNVRRVRQPEFDRMRRDMRFVRPGRQWPGGSGLSEKYEANITHRTMRSRVSSLYAKNPKVIAKRKPRMDFSMWDGDPQTLMLATASMQGQGPMDPMEAAAIVQDFQQGMQKKRLMNMVGRTLQTLANYFMGEGTPTFKTQLKQLIRRVEACGVGFVQLGFQRKMQKSPELENKLESVYDQLCTLENMAKEIAQDLVQHDGPTPEQLRLSLAALQGQFDVIVREGLVYDWPKSTNILVDLNCTQLKGFIGADRVAREYFYTVEKVRELFNVDVSGSVKKRYDMDTGMQITTDAGMRKKRQGVCVLCIWERSTGLEYFVCEGWNDFLEEPGPPSVKLEQFWPLYTLSFHDIESEDSADVYPPSTFQLVRPMNLEYNRSREAIRIHRIASRPAYIVAKGAFSKTDKMLLATHRDMELIELDIPQEAMGKPIEEFLMEKPVPKLDPAVYEVESVFTDVQRVLGEAEPNLGGTQAGVTATQSTIAEQSRLSTNSSDVDELDDFLSALARGSGQVLMLEMSLPQVQAIVGPAAVWPEFTRTQVAEEVFLEVKAGSSGRPNKATDITNMERLVPLLVQIPGIKPMWMAEKAITSLDADIDLEDAFDPNMPSITMMNAQKQPGTGDPATDPKQQGGEGGSNLEKAQAHRPGPKPNLPPFNGQPGP